MDQQVAIPPKPDVLMLALARHDGQYSSTAWSLAKEFARESRVIYIDNPFTLTDLLQSQKQAQIRKRYFLGLFRRRKVLRPDSSTTLLVVVPPIMLPINWLPEGVLYTMMARINNWLLKKAVEKVLKEQGVSNYLYINSFNPFYGKKGDFEPAPSFYIYQTVDEMGHSKYVAKHGPRLEKKAMQEAGAVIATSRELQKKAQREAIGAVYIPNAADMELFRTAMEKKLPVPPELEGEQRKVVCYTGHVDHRLDYSLLKEVARLHPDKLFLMVGPVSGSEVKESGFADLPNVQFTGKKKLPELPAYLQHAHCAIIPFKCNSLTAGIYPLKINEYLGAGRGVVATPFSEDIKDFAEVISLAETAAAFAEAIQQLLDTDHKALRELRLRRAMENSWQARVSSIWELVEQRNKKELLKEQKTYEEEVK